MTQDCWTIYNLGRTVLTERNYLTNKASISDERFWRTFVYNLIASHLCKPNLRNISWKLSQPVTWDRSLIYNFPFTGENPSNIGAVRKEARMQPRWCNKTVLEFASYLRTARRKVRVGEGELELLGSSPRQRVRSTAADVTRCGTSVERGSLGGGIPVQRIWIGAMDSTTVRHLLFIKNARNI